MRYEIQWIAVINQWAVVDHTKTELYKFIFKNEDKEVCEKHIRDLKDQEEQISFF